MDKSNTHEEINSIEANKGESLVAKNRLAEFYDNEKICEFESC